MAQGHTAGLRLEAFLNPSAVCFCWVTPSHPRSRTAFDTSQHSFSGVFCAWSQLKARTRPGGVNAPLQGEEELHSRPSHRCLGVRKESRGRGTHPHTRSHTGRGDRATPLGPQPRPACALPRALWPRRGDGLRGVQTRRAGWQPLGDEIYDPALPQRDFPRRIVEHS